MSISRRDFLKLTGSLSAPLILPQGAWGAAPAGGDTLVFLFLRGGLDALNFLVPHGDARYYALRPSLAIPQPDPGNPDAAIDLDGFYGLHPQLAPLADLYSGGRLALVAAAGSPDPSHSHFESQDYAESGTPGDKSTTSGWIGRHLELTEGTGSFRAVGMGGMLQKSLYGPVPAITIPSVESFGLVTGGRVPDLELALQTLYAGDNPLRSDAARAFDAVGEFAAADPARFQPENGAGYPESELGTVLKETGQLIKAGLGSEVICVDAGGWDTHDGEAATLEGLFADLAGSLAAFHTDMGERMAGICLVAMSEFGRRAYENASGGTDHGHGGCMLLLGGGVNGGRVYGDWPTLEQGRLYGPGDLAVTTDFRTVLSEVAERRLGAPDLGALFPGFSQTPYLGICSGV